MSIASKAERATAPRSKSYRVGDRVRYMGPAFLGPKSLSVGTVALVAGPRGQSVHPDPSRIMTFVKWDGGTAEGVYTRMLQPAVRCSKCKGWLHADGNGTCGRVIENRVCNGLVEVVLP